MQLVLYLAIYLVCCIAVVFLPRRMGLAEGAPDYAFGFMAIGIVLTIYVAHRMSELKERAEKAEKRLRELRKRIRDRQEDGDLENDFDKELDDLDEGEEDEPGEDGDEMHGAEK